MYFTYIKVNFKNIFVDPAGRVQLHLWWAAHVNRWRGDEQLFKGTGIDAVPFCYP